jgi:hypothetical protein
MTSSHCSRRWARAARVLVALAAIGACAATADAAGAAPAAPPTTTTRTLSFADAPFTGISVCAPVALLVTPAASEAEAWTVTLSGPTSAVEALDIHRTSPGTGSLSIEAARPFDTGATTPLRLQVAVPPRVLQYVERVHAPGDTWIAAEFAAEKAEVAVAGDGVVLAPAMGSGMAKLSLAGPGPAVLGGSWPWGEIFVTGGGVAHASGATGTVRVKVDEGGSVQVAPAFPNVTVDGWVGGGGASLTLTQGECFVADERDGGDGSGKPPACGRGGSADPPVVKPRWACGLATSGAWRCGGGGVEGAPGVTLGPCEAGEKEVAMAPVA